MKKSLILISLIACLSMLIVGCDNVIPNSELNAPNNNQENMSVDNNSSGVDNTNTEELEIVKFEPKILAPTPEGELVSEDVAMSNAIADSEKYSDIEKNPVVTMKIKDHGTVVMELYPKVAPETVENFISLINKNVYDGLIFHRTIPGFMAQGGDPDGNGSGGPDYSIVGEFTSNGFENALTHERGLLSMARSNENNSAGSQFFIVTTDSVYLDGSYAGFGRVLEGMDVVDKVVNSKVIIREDKIDLSKISTIEEYIELVSNCDRPINPPVIESMTVDTFGVEYDEPQKIREEVAAQ